MKSDWGAVRYLLSFGLAWLVLVVVVAFAAWVSGSCGKGPPRK